MSRRAMRLAFLADAQIAEVIALVTSAGDAGLRLPCPGREKLADGSVGAVAAHVARSYEAIGDLVARRAARSARAGSESGDPALDVAPGATSARASSYQGGPEQHVVPQSVQAGSALHAAPEAGEGQDSAALVRGLARARDALAGVANLDDRALDAVPAATEMRFCDGSRTLEEVLSALLKHQSHSVEAIASALDRSPAQG